jgi:uncharacterized membrane protein (DUF4010 family)
MKRKSATKLDFPFLAPAVLCNIAFILGTLPPVFCLDATLFAYVSVGIFLLSILIHIYILWAWKRYQDSSPLGYAIVQPALHMIMLVYALAVGAADFCAAKPTSSKTLPFHHYLPPPPDISEAISAEKEP